MWKLLFICCDIWGLADVLAPLRWWWRLCFHLCQHHLTLCLQTWHQPLVYCWGQSWNRFENNASLSMIIQFRAVLGKFPLFTRSFSAALHPLTLCTTEIRISLNVLTTYLVCVCVCGTSHRGNGDALPVAPSGLVFNISVIVFKAMNEFPGDALWHGKATAALSHQTKYGKHWSEERAVSHQVY